jgi:hypothetical protein
VFVSFPLIYLVANKEADTNVVKEIQDGHIFDEKISPTYQIDGKTIVEQP